jgi:hypothetical protein
LHAPSKEYRGAGREPFRHRQGRKEVPALLLSQTFLRHFRLRAEARGPAENAVGVVFPHDPEGIRTAGEGAPVFVNEYELFLTELKDARGISYTPGVTFRNFAKTSPTTATFTIRYGLWLCFHGSIQNDDDSSYGYGCIVSGLS